MKKKAVFACVAALALLAGGFLAARGRVYQKQLFAMDTVMSFTAYGLRGEAAVQAAMEEVQRLDALLSIGLPDSEVSRLNREGGGTVSADTIALLTAADAVYTGTGGLFDCTVYPLMELWGFPSGNYHVPSEAEIAEVLPLVDQSRLRLEGDALTLGPGQRIDFGGIAKGYAAARVMDLFREAGVSSGMVSLGGNVQVLGSKPDGSPWRIGVRDPEGGAYLAVLSVRDKAVVTSGGYERYFEKDGETYIHILDPRTGRPAQSDLLSATVISSDGTAADALSTALFILGTDAAADYWRSHTDQFDMLLASSDGTLYATPGAAAVLETDRELVVIEPSQP